MSSLCRDSATPRTPATTCEVMSSADGHGRRLGGNPRRDELLRESDRLLPAKTARLGWDHNRYTLLHDIQLGSAGDFLRGNRRLHLAAQLRTVESLPMPNSLLRT